MFLLGFIDQNPIHGYDLFKLISQFNTIYLVWRIKQSQLYALLDRLEDDGLVVSSMIPGESHPNRKQYQITSVGRQTFFAWRISPVQHERDVRQEFLAKIYFALQSGHETVLELLETQTELCFEWLSQLQNDLMSTNRISDI